MTALRCFVVNSSDNVATLLDDATPGPVQVLGQGGGQIELRDVIKLGHKCALIPRDAGEPIVKFGVPIGRAKLRIERGDWVHLHNCESLFDERSKTLDVNTGAVTDTTYE